MMGDLYSATFQRSGPISLEKKLAGLQHSPAAAQLHWRDDSTRSTDQNLVARKLTTAPIFPCFLLLFF